MEYAQIMSLILNIAISMNVPPYFALSIALTENPTLNPLAIHINENGTKDRGIFQINDSWDKSDWTDIETNIRVGIGYIKELSRNPYLNTWYGVAICYNAGTRWIKYGNPPETSLDYAEKVMALWQKLDRYSMAIISRQYKN